jgi:hypothetical protein
MKANHKYLVLSVAALAVMSLLGAVPSTAGAAKPLSAPVFTSKATLKAKTLATFTFTVKAKANPAPTISLVSGLPTGVTFTPNAPVGTTGTATVTGSVPGGTYPPIVLQATNTQGSVTQDLTIAVKGLPGIRHVFVIMLENEGYDQTFGDPSSDPYLASTLPGEGALLENYYGVGHFSNDNYVGFVSGQLPNSSNQADCAGGFDDFPAGDGLDANGLQQGSGCVYPSDVPTIADQLTAKGDTWKAYEEDMGNDPTRESATCGHPAIGSPDNTLEAETGDGYATRHDPFVYFHSIIDDTSECNQDVVPLGTTTGALPAGTPAGVTGLATDLQSVSTTPNYSFITPNLCDDGHDYPCKNQPSGASALADIDTFLQTWVPLITGSPAFQQDGLLEITFDEADVDPIDATSCCGESENPAALNGENGIDGPGGGRIGSVLISPFITPGSKVKTSLNHYSSLASIEDLFDLPHLGAAKSVTSTFDKVYAK